MLAPLLLIGAGAWYATVMAAPLRIGLPKGRVLGDVLDLFAKAGLPLEAVRAEGSRRLVHPFELDAIGPVEVLILRAADVVTYVEHGACALGVVGQDVIAEERPDV